MRGKRMTNGKWRLALIATIIDLVYISLVVVFKQQLSNAGIVGTFFSYYLPYFLHFPFALLFFGLNYWYLYFFLSIQTFVVFLLIGFGCEKHKKISVIFGFVFYLILVSLAIVGSLNGWL